MKNEQVEKAVSILEESKNYVCEELKNEPMLSLRVSNTMQTLINGLKHVGGFTGQVTEKPTSTIQPAKSFMGLDLQDLNAQNVPAEVNVHTDELEAFKAKVTELHAGFLGRDENELKESLTKDELLGVAKLSGITVEEPSKQGVTLKLIREVKAAIEANQALVDEKNAKKQDLNAQNEGEGV